MQVKIKGTNLDLTPAIRTYVQDKLGSLMAMLDRLNKKGAMEARLEISRTTKHHEKGPVFRAECNLVLPGKLLRAEHSDWNIRRAIDEIKNELQQEIKKYAARLRPQDSRGQEQLRKLRGK